MANLQMLRKRYKSIRATADMAAAMKTAATVKYAKISKILSSINAYSRACDEALELFGTGGLSRRTDTVNNRNCILVLSGNRGFCGGFNAELLRYFEEQMKQESEKPLLLVSGLKAINFCREKGFEFEQVDLPDIPAYQDAEKLTARLYEIYASGEADHVNIVYQHFENMMSQIPTVETILPRIRENTAELQQDLLFLPDRDSAQKDPAMYCLINSIYRIMLSHNAGAQAATTIAMRSACDNADESLEKLETLINRIRQAEVTNSVIETSSFLAGINMEN